MIEERYDNFDNLFLDLNRKIVEDPDRYLQYKSADNFYLDFLYLIVDNPVANLDFSFLGFKTNKFYKLVESYINLDEWERFKKKISKTRSLNITFYFNQQKKKGNNQDASPCILSLVFAREKRQIKFNKATLFYRTTELCKTFYVDLVLMDRLLKDLGDLVEIKRFEIVSPNAFFKGHRSFWLLDYLNISLNDDNYLKYYLRNEREKLTKRKDSKFSMERRTQRYLKEHLTYKPINMEEITLYKGDV